jgi:hypothetical protein
MVPYGYVRVIQHGHPRADSLGHVLEHVLIAERALGKPLPAGADVHHVDENKGNNANANLVICQDRAYHRLLHVRARIVRAGGNPNTECICTKCQRVLPRSSFAKASRHKALGLQRRCRECFSAHTKTYGAIRRARDRAKKFDEQYQGVEKRTAA